MMDTHETPHSLLHREHKPTRGKQLPQPTFSDDTYDDAYDTFDDDDGGGQFSGGIHWRMPPHDLLMSSVDTSRVSEVDGGLSGLGGLAGDDGDDDVVLHGLGDAQLSRSERGDAAAAAAAGAAGGGAHVRMATSVSPGSSFGDALSKVLPVSVVVTQSDQIRPVHASPEKEDWSRAPAYRMTASAQEPLRMNGPQDVYLERSTELDGSDGGWHFTDDDESFAASPAARTGLPSESVGPVPPSASPELLRNLLSSARQQLETARFEADQYSKVMAEMQSEQAQLEAVNHDFYLVIKTLRQQLLLAEQHNKDLNAALALGGSKRPSAKQVLESSVGLRALRGQQLDLSQREVGKLKTLLVSKSMQVKQLEQRIRLEQARRDANTEGIAQECTMLRQELAQSQAVLQAREQTLSTTEADAKGGQDALAAERDALRDELAVQREAAAQLTAQLDEMRASRDHAALRAAQLDDVLQRVHEDAKAKEQEAAEARQHAVDANEMVQQLRDQVDDLLGRKPTHTTHSDEDALTRKYEAELRRTREQLDAARKELARSRRRPVQVDTVQMGVQCELEGVPSQEPLESESDAEGPRRAERSRGRNSAELLREAQGECDRLCRANARLMEQLAEARSGTGNEPDTTPSLESLKACVASLAKVLTGAQVDLSADSAAAEVGALCTTVRACIHAARQQRSAQRAGLSTMRRLLARIEADLDPAEEQAEQDPADTPEDVVLAEMQAIAERLRVVLLGVEELAQAELRAREHKLIEQTRADTLTRDLHRAKARQQELETRCQQLERGAEVAERRVGEATASLVDAEDQRKQVEQDIEHQVRSLEDRLEAAETERNDAVDAVQELEESLAAADEQRGAAEHRSRQLQAQLVDSLQRVADLQAALEKTQHGHDRQPLALERQPAVSIDPSCNTKALGVQVVAEVEVKPAPHHPRTPVLPRPEALSPAQTQQLFESCLELSLDPEGTVARFLRQSSQRGRLSDGALLLMELHRE